MEYPVNQNWNNIHISVPNVLSKSFLAGWKYFRKVLNVRDFCLHILQQKVMYYYFFFLTWRMAKLQFLVKFPWNGKVAWIWFNSYAEEHRVILLFWAIMILKTNFPQILSKIVSWKWKYICNRRNRCETVSRSLLLSTWKCNYILCTEPTSKVMEIVFQSLK